MHDPIELPSSAARRAFLRGAVAAGALAGIALALPMLPARAVELRFGDALRLEFLEELQGLSAEFFLRAAQSSVSDGLLPGESSVLSLIAAQDNPTMRWSRLARRRFGGIAFERPIVRSASKSAPTYPFALRTFEKRSDLMKTAIEIKSIVARAWVGAAADADRGEIAAGIAALAGVQNRHLAALQAAAKENPLVAMVEPLAPREATLLLAKFGFKGASLQ